MACLLQYCFKIHFVYLLGGGWAWVRWGNIKCGANALAFVLACTSFNFKKGWLFGLSMFVVCFGGIGHNGLGLCVRAGFGAQSFNLLLKFHRSTKLQVCKSARLTQNPCYRLVFYIPSLLAMSLYKFGIPF
jgi:hypothetical protein